MTQLSRYICIPNLVFTCVQASHQCNGPLNPNLIVANEEPSTNCASLPVCHRQQLPPPRSANLLERKNTAPRAEEPENLLGLPTVRVSRPNYAGIFPFRYYWSGAKRRSLPKWINKLEKGGKEKKNGKQKGITVKSTMEQCLKNTRTFVSQFYFN